MIDVIKPFFMPENVLLEVIDRPLVFLKVIKNKTVTVVLFSVGNQYRTLESKWNITKYETNSLINF